MTAALNRAADSVRLSARTLLSLLLTVLMLGATELALKAIRVAQYRYDTAITLAQRLGLCVSELLALAGLTSLALSVALLGRAWRMPRVAMLCIQGLVLVSFVAACLSHGYFLQTGGTLDYTMVAFAALRPSETAPIVASAVVGGLRTLLEIVPPCLLLPGVWFMVTVKPEREPALRAGLLWRSSAWAGLSLLCFVGASLVRVDGVEPGFAREPVAQLVRGFWTARTASRHIRNSQVAARKHGPSRLRRVDQRAPYNLVFIVLESARADATTPYAPNLATTPFLARLAAEGTLVERAYTVVPHTSKSLVAMLCGFEPRTSTELVETQPLGLPGVCLPSLLRSAGYDSVFFQAPRKAFEDYPQLMRNLGFARFIAGDDMPRRGFESVNYFGYEDAILLGPSYNWLRTQAHEPFIAAYLTNASHHPYASPKAWRKKRLSGNPTKNDYLNALSYVDSVVASVVEQYKQLGLYERTLFVVLGDHGEGFAEHGMWTHDDILYEEGVRIPLVFRAPAAQQRATRVAGPVNQLAIAPTVLDVLGFAPEGGSYEADSVYARATQEPVQLACFRNAHCLASVRENHKLIYYYADRLPQLYDLVKDPHERHNLAAEQPRRVQAWVRDLLDWETAVDKLHAQTSQLAVHKYVQRTAPSSMQHAREVHFADVVDLIGFDAESTRPDGAHFTTYLRVRKTMPPGYHFALRLSSGFWYAKTLDEQPVRGLYPYYRWRPGDYIANLQRTDWPETWSIMEACLELLDADNFAVEARSATGESFRCVPLTTLDHRTQREIKQ